MKREREFVTNKKVKRIAIAGLIISSLVLGIFPYAQGKWTGIMQYGAFLTAVFCCFIIWGVK